MEMKDYLFVYGTLSPKHAPSEIRHSVRRLHPISSATVKGYLYDLGEYPAAILDASTRRKITGQVFELPADPSVLRSLDAYEGYKPKNVKESLFIRRRTTVVLDDGQELECWIYIYNRDLGAAPLIASGNYAKSKAA